MSPQRFAGLAVVCGTLALSGWGAAGLGGLGSRNLENDAAQVATDGVSIRGMIDAAFSELRQMPEPAQKSALPFDIPNIETILAALPDPRDVLRTVWASIPDAVQNNVEVSTVPVVIAAASLDAHEVPSGTTPPAVFTLASAPDSVQDDVQAPQAKPNVRLVSLFRSDVSEEDLKPAARVVETPNECLVAEICIDDYLWAFYERTPKVDSNKVKERVKATVTRKGKTRTVMKTITKYVAADFTWKDPIAAQKAGMSVKDYVIGGMDRGFRLKLYHALRAMENAGLMPGITSAFRDDYRQAIASGNKAASDSSFHGGSRRGGYGHGLAADLVSVKGETRTERFASTVEMWKWIDAHERELGIGRPYLNRDPPHVGPIDGKEFAAKRGGAKAKLAARITNRRHPVAAGGNPGTIKPVAKAGPIRVGSL